jgi:hypothetical protein
MARDETSILNYLLKVDGSKNYKEVILILRMVFVLVVALVMGSLFFKGFSSGDPLLGGTSSLAGFGSAFVGVLAGAAGAALTIVILAAVTKLIDYGLEKLSEPCVRPQSTEPVRARMISAVPGWQPGMTSGPAFPIYRGSARQGAGDPAAAAQFEGRGPLLDHEFTV